MPTLSGVARTTLLAIVCISLLLAVPSTTAASKWWGGAAVGASFGGSVNYASVEPVIGYWLTEKLTVGGRMIMRYTKDERFENSQSQTDYGVTAFTRFFPLKRVFVQGEIEWLSYERLAGASVARDNYTSLWVGAGYAQPITRNSWFSVVGMYNLTWKDDEPSPYTDPWVLRAGLGFRF